MNGGLCIEENKVEERSKASEGGESGGSKTEGDKIVGRGRKS